MARSGRLTCGSSGKGRSIRDLGYGRGKKDDYLPVWERDHRGVGWEPRRNLEKGRSLVDLLPGPVDVPSAPLEEVPP